MPCSSCRFYFASGPDHICRRFPPTPYPLQQPSRITGRPEMSIVSVWPPVAPDHECGEYITQLALSS